MAGWALALLAALLGWVEVELLEHAVAAPATRAIAKITGTVCLLVLIITIIGTRPDRAGRAAFAGEPGPWDRYIN